MPSASSRRPCRTCAACARSWCAATREPTARSSTCALTGRVRSLQIMASPISFARGAPSLDIIDVDGLRAAAEQAFAADPGGMTAYGTAIGYPPLRAWIAERHQVAPEQVVVTNGSMQADAFLFEALVEAGDSVIVERPTYDRTLLSLRSRGADVRMVELEPDGIDVAALERVLAAGARPKLAHIIPNFQNPAGYTLSAEKRERLLELARDHEFTIFEDDPYVALRFQGAPLPTMLSLDPGDTVVYASSFSKTVCPGIRVGYLVGPAELIAKVVKIATHTYISPSMVSQAIVHQFCLSGALESSIESVRKALHERARHALRGARARAARRPLRQAARRLLPVGRPAARNRRRGAVRSGRRARGPVRQGIRLRPRRRRVEPAAGLLGRHAGGDRGGRQAPRRRLPLAERDRGRRCGLRRSPPSATSRARRPPARPGRSTRCTPVSLAACGAASARRRSR